MSDFRGFPPELFTFFEGLAADNSKTNWEANRPIWDEHVRSPMLLLLDELAEEFGPMRMFRPNRDVRFSRDKSPYKLWAAATSESRAVGGVGYYVQVSATGMLAGYGAMVMAPDQLQRFRAAVDADDSGRELEGILSDLEARSTPVSSGAEPPLKRVPRGYPADHPRAELLRWKGAVVVREFDRAEWMHGPAALDAVRDTWRGARPLKDWLDAHVGGSTAPG